MGIEGLEGAWSGLGGSGIILGVQILLAIRTEVAAWAGREEAGSVERGMNAAAGAAAASSARMVLRMVASLSDVENLALDPSS